ncbi:MAG: class D beta-lactamase [Anaerolineaceae bacterium]
MLTSFRLPFLLYIILISILLVGCSQTQINPLSTPTPNQPSFPTVTGGPVSEIQPELEKYFQGANGALVLYDLKYNRYIRYNPDRCAQGFIPASTFKIMNSLIGLETGVIPDESYLIKWNGTPNEVPTWNQDHTLKSAIKNSVVWYYQELARRVGKDKMQQYVDTVGYGNKDISGKIDTFWLEGGLRISADEQVEFLKRLYQNELPFSSRSMKIVKEIIVLEKTETYQLSGKTGSGVRMNTPFIGWFVGFLETKGNVYFFAVNYESTNPDGFANGDTARKMSVEVLRGLGLLP